jgi:hypothetical protein
LIINMEQRDVPVAERIQQRQSEPALITIDSRGTLGDSDGR